MPWAPTCSVMFFCQRVLSHNMQDRSEFTCFFTCLLQGHSTQILRRSCFLFLSTLAVLLSELPSAFHSAVWWGDFHIRSPVWNSGGWKGCCKCWPKLTFTENRPRKGCSACNLSIYFLGEWLTLCSNCVPEKTTISQLISFNTVPLLIRNLILIKMPSISTFLFSDWSQSKAVSLTHVNFHFHF